MPITILHEQATNSLFLKALFMLLLDVDGVSQSFDLLFALLLNATIVDILVYSVDTIGIDLPSLHFQFIQVPVSF